MVTVNFFFVFIEFVTILLLFYVLVFFFFSGHEACGIPAPQPGVEPTLPTLVGEVSTTGPPGKSPQHYLLLLETICPNLQQRQPWHSF